MKRFLIRYYHIDGTATHAEYAAITKNEALGLFFTDHIMIAYDDIIEVKELS